MTRLTRGDPGGEALALNGSSGYVDVSTAVDLALSRTISVTLDVDFSVNPGAQTQVLLEKDPGDASVAPYGVRVAPATGPNCTSSSSAAVELMWGGQWIASKPLSWGTSRWYTLRVQDDGTTISFYRGPSPSQLTHETATPDPTSATGTQSSSGSLYLGRGPAGSDPLSGELQDVQLAVPLTVAPKVSAETLSYTSAAIGTPLTVTANITGAWGNPDDPYLPSPTSTTSSTRSSRSRPTWPTRDRSPRPR